MSQLTAESCLPVPQGAQLSHRRRTAEHTLYDYFMYGVQIISQLTQSLTGTLRTPAPAHTLLTMASLGMCAHGMECKRDYGLAEQCCLYMCDLRQAGPSLLSSSTSRLRIDAQRRPQSIGAFGAALRAVKSTPGAVKRTLKSREEHPSEL